MASRMPGTTVRSLKQHPALIPLLISVGAGSCLAAFYVLRLATRNPDVSWNKEKNPYPWNRLGETGQYKFWSSFDYSKLKKPSDRPDV